MDVAVIGLGKLGAPLAALLAARGHDVRGADLSSTFVERINEGLPPVEETGLASLMEVAHDRLRATTDVEAAVRGTDATCVIVPTPSGPDGQFSLDYIIPAIEAVGRAIQGDDRYHVVLIISTVMPGSTDGPIREALERTSTRKVGDDVGLCYSPEFIALGSVIADMEQPDMVLIGESDVRAGDVAEELLGSIPVNTPSVRRMTAVNAEITKISVNSYVTMKISFANFLADLCDHVPGADVDVVTDALGSDKRIGHHYLKGRTAYGGPCFPRDNVALGVYARSRDVDPALPEATDRINDRQHDRLLEIVERVRPADGRVAVLGLSYKPGTGVIECAAGVRLAADLAAKGVEVCVFDPAAMSSIGDALPPAVTRAPSADACVRGAHVVVLATPWPAFASVALSDDTSAVIDVWRQVESAAPGVRVIRPGRSILGEDL